MGLRRTGPRLLVREVSCRFLISGREAQGCWIEREKKEDKEWARSESRTFREEVTEERVLGRVYVPRRSDAGGRATCRRTPGSHRKHQEHREHPSR